MTASTAPRVPPLPACGERSRAQRAGEGALLRLSFSENPPHPDPLPAGGERERTEVASLYSVHSRPRFRGGELQRESSLIKFRIWVPAFAGTNGEEQSQRNHMDEN